MTGLPNCAAERGGNNPPLAELLAEEVSDLAHRAADLKGYFDHSANYDLPRLADLSKLMSALIQSAETRRKERKAPFLADGKAIDAAYDAVIGHARPNEVSGVYEMRAAIAGPEARPSTQSP